MAETRVERRLAAILAADVAGYSRLMGINEEGTLAALKVCRRELIDPKIAEHRGRIVKTTGDGALVEFASAVDATRCAMEIQHAMAERNAAIPKDRRVEFRIGINVGDIIIDEADIYGDGASRVHCRAWWYLSFRGRVAAGARQGRGQLHRCRRAEPEKHRAPGAGLSGRTRQAKLRGAGCTNIANA